MQHLFSLVFLLMSFFFLSDLSFVDQTLYVRGWASAVKVGRFMSKHAFQLDMCSF